MPHAVVDKGQDLPSPASPQMCGLQRDEVEEWLLSGAHLDSDVSAA